MIRRTVLAITTAAVLAGCGPSGQLDGLSAGETGRVVEIREGDDFVLDTGLEVRLAGVEAPHGAAPGAQAAKDALARLAQGQQVALFYGGARRDRYGRAIAQVRVRRSGAWVQDALLKAGQVRVHTWPDNVALAGVMLRTEATARIARKGVWGLSTYRVLLPSEAAAAEGFTVIEGRVVWISETARSTWLDFAEGGTAILVPAPSLANFTTAGADLPALRGHIIRVRGRIARGVLTLDHPAALERVSN